MNTPCDDYLTFDGTSVDVIRILTRIDDLSTQISQLKEEISRLQDDFAVILNKN